MRISTTLLSLTLAIAVSGVHAQTYRWIDKDGKKRYGDVAPPGVKATLMKPPSGAAAGPVQAEKGAQGDKAETGGEKKTPALSVSPEQAYRERQLKAKDAQEKAEKDRLAAERKRQNCAAAQESLRTLETGRRLSSVNAKGETVILDDAQVKARVDVARKAADDSCN